MEIRSRQMRQSQRLVPPIQMGTIRPFLPRAEVGDIRAHVGNVFSFFFFPSLLSTVAEAGIHSERVGDMRRDCRFGRMPPDLTAVQKGPAALCAPWIQHKEGGDGRRCARSVAEPHIDRWDGMQRGRE